MKNKEKTKRVSGNWQILSIVFDGPRILRLMATDVRTGQEHEFTSPPPTELGDRWHEIERLSLNDWEIYD